MNNEKIIYSLFAVMLITRVTDIYTAYTNPVFLIGETNPLFVLTGGTTLLTILNFGLIIYILYFLICLAYLSR